MTVNPGLACRPAAEVEEQIDAAIAVLALLRERATPMQAINALVLALANLVANQAKDDAVSEATDLVVECLRNQIAEMIRDGEALDG